MSDSGPVLSPTPITAVAPGRRHTWWCLTALYSLAVVWGIRNIRQGEPSGMDLLVPLAFSICLSWWALVDARKRGHPIPMLATQWFFPAAPLVVPGYFLRTRGWRGAGWILLHVVLWYALATVALHAGGLAVYGGEWLRALGLRP